MKATTYAIASAVLLAFSCAGLGWWAYELRLQLRALEAEREDLRSAQEELAGQLADLSAQVSEKTGKAASLASELTAAKSLLGRLKEEKQAAQEAKDRLAEEMEHALREQEVTISRLKGKLTVNILDQVLFDSGKAELKDQGRQLLLKVAEVLKTVPDRQVVVVGHTDNVPVIASRHLYASNWELSAARATAAVRFLCEQGGVDPRTMGALAYGQHHPAADNATAGGRARNRRIEVVILDKGVLPGPTAATE
jgi:chemotaxis protein MotB